MGSNSGINKVQLNQLERALSDDVNLLQQKLARAMQQRFSRMMSDFYADTLDGLGGWQQRGVATVQTLQSPLNADVYGGLMMRISGATDLIVDPGVLGTVDTSFSGDTEDSDYIYVDDPGIAPGTLTFSANAGPGVRVDVVECEVDDDILLQEPRDIFDVPTQTFVPTPVIKARAARLTYRIRAGAPGAGFPGTVSGWLPLAIAIHPSGTATFADVDFFDVRPLVSDLSRGPTKRGVVESASRTHLRTNGIEVNGGADEMVGWYDLEGNGEITGELTYPYVCQGRIKSTIPGASTSYVFSAQDTDNHAAAYVVPGSNAFAYVYALLPEGLPRWVHYATTDAGQGERLPENVMGIVCVSDTVPQSGGNPNNKIVPPTVTGLLAAAPGKHLATLRASPSATNSFLQTFETQGQWRINFGSGGGLTFNGTQTASSTTDEDLEFDFGNLGGILIPGNTYGIWVAVGIEGPATTETNVTLSLTFESAGVQRYRLSSSTVRALASGSNTEILQRLFLPLPRSAYTGMNDTAFKLVGTVSWVGASNFSVSSRSCSIEGYSLKQ